MDGRIEPPILWREGMFLCPQHFQAHSREIASRLYRGDAIGSAGAWGLISIVIDEEPLEQNVFSLRETSLVFKDGTLLEFPGNAVAEPRNFEALFTGPELDVFLGVPAPLPNIAQIDAGEKRARFRVEAKPVYDENVRDSTKELEFRELQARLFFGEEDKTGFEWVQIARLVRQGRPVMKSVISPDWVPTCLVVGASGVLKKHFREIAELLRAQARDLAVRVPPTQALSSVDKGPALAGFLKLHTANQCMSLMDQVAGVHDLHPFEAYRTLASIIGQLAVFSESRTVPDFPVYDHGRTSECFGAAIKAVRDLIQIDVTVPYDTVVFKKDAVREGFFEIEIPREWLKKPSIYYLAVEIAKPAELISELVSGGVKLVAPADVERVLTGVIPGIDLRFERTPPLSFPRRADLHFFRIETEGNSREAWLHISQESAAVLLSTLGVLGEVKYHLYVELHN